jgi:hypothetical protein
MGGIRETRHEIMHKVAAEKVRDSNTDSEDIE